MIDLFSRPVTFSPGAHRGADYVELTESWAPLVFEATPLTAGWYKLSVDMACAGLCLQLTEGSTHLRLELSANATTPAYVWLAEGTYKPEWYAGARPGRYPVTFARLEQLSFARRMALFAGRFAQALRDGAGPRLLVSLVRRALSPGRSIGVRAPGTGQATLGVLTQADLSRAPSTSSDVAVLTGGPRFHVRGMTGSLTPESAHNAGLSRQTCQAFSLERAECDAEIVIGSEDVLTPDAVALFAAAFARQPDVSVVIADVWVDGVPTLRPAFDPLLYGEDQYPTPYARRLQPKPIDLPWVQARHSFAVIAVPVAHAKADNLPPPAPVLVPDRALASIIIPTRDGAELMRACLAGLFEATDWPHEVIVVDNGSTDPETFAVFESYAATGLRVVRADIPFNFSTLCNLGAETAQGKFLVFVNNDIVFSGPDWLTHMIGLAANKNIGAVGARLLYADRTLQHGGVALGLTQLCGHLWRGLAKEDQQALPALTRNSLRLAVTAALLCVDRSKFDAVGGFDADAFPVTLNDIDLCLRLYAQGWFSAYAAGAEAYHLEGVSRGYDETPEKSQRRQAEMDAFSARWGAFVDHDPWLPAAAARSIEAFRFR